ncbi:hypothetical protein [uncultured Desulfovibrio sp.]|mgnify:CR=1 FL=1|uniref:hypothetical protein n=1 Tax=uncultured Desulfovibrio sp. TaxID=167968 RepID=UPI00258F28EA|nr:hypothetical protein [uncultured Desulfovibrio sp.]
MDFKEQIARDARHVFLNNDEFAELVLLAGKEVMAQVIWEPSEYPQGQSPMLGRSRVRIHVAELDAPQEWKQGKSMNFNGADWVIDSRRACAGLVAFDLSIEQGGGAGW